MLTSFLNHLNPCPSLSQRQSNQTKMTFCSNDIESWNCNVYPITPGSMVLWEDDIGTFCYAMVIQFEEYFDSQLYSLTIIHNNCIRMLLLNRKDYNKTWRVLHAS
jgi:hypothetical protein